jgi:hypothetical protein
MKDGLLHLSDHEAYRIVQRLERHSGTSTELFSDLHSLGEAGRIESRAVVESYLRDSDPELRSIALGVLTFHWHLPEHWKTCVRMIEEDKDEEVCRTAVAGLGSLQTGTRDPETLAVLLRVFTNEKEAESIRMMSYSSILRVLGHHLVDGITLRPVEPSDIRDERVAEVEEIVKGRTSD